MKNSSGIRPLTPPPLRIEAKTRRRVRRYFTHGKPKWPKYMLWWAPGLSVIGSVIAATGLALWHGLALIPLGAGLWYVARTVKKRPLRVATEAEVDSVAAREFTEARARADRECQLERGEQRGEQPVCFRSTRNSRVLEGIVTKQRIGGDERARWTPHELSIVHLTQDRLFVYQCMIDLTTGKAMHEATYELSVRDVVSLDCTSERETRTIPTSDKLSLKYWADRGIEAVDRVLQLDGVQQVALRLANGEHITLATWEGQIALRQPVEVELNRTSFQQLRRLLREQRKESGARTQRPPKIVRHSG